MTSEEYLASCLHNVLRTDHGIDLGSERYLNHLPCLQEGHKYPTLRGICIGMLAKTPRHREAQDGQMADQE